MANSFQNAPYTLVIKTHTAENGMVLVVALVLLAVMTVLGVAALDTTRLGERIASNSQQKSTAFEAAESTIAEGLDITRLLGVMAQQPIPGVSEFAQYTPPGVNQQLSNALDQTNSTGSIITIDIDAELVIAYCGDDGAYTGSELNADISTPALAGHLYDVHGLAEIAGSRARAAHVQRAVLIRPRTNRGDTCPSPLNRLICFK